MQTRPRPPPPLLAEPVAALLAGDPGPFNAMLDTLSDWRLTEVQHAWWELSTLYGAVLGCLEVHADKRIIPYTINIRPFINVGDPRHRLAEPEVLARAWRRELAEPPSRERHRLNLVATLALQRADRHEQPDAADAVLRHHTDLPVDLFAGRPVVGLDPASRGVTPDHG